MSTTKNTGTPALEVQFARISTGALSVARFDMGSDQANADQALRHAWNNRLTIRSALSTQEKAHG